MHDFAVLESHYHDVREFDFLPSWRDPRQQVIPLCVVSEAHNEFVYDLVLADGPGNGRHLRVFGDLVYEVLAVKAADALTPEASCHDRNAVDIGFGDMVSI